MLLYLIILHLIMYYRLHSICLICIVIGWEELLILHKHELQFQLCYQHIGLCSHGIFAVILHEKQVIIISYLSTLDIIIITGVTVKAFMFVHVSLFI